MTEVHAQPTTATHAKRLLENIADLLMSFLDFFRLTLLGLLGGLIVRLVIENQISTSLAEILMGLVIGGSLVVIGTPRLLKRFLVQG